MKKILALCFICAFLPIRSFADPIDSLKAYAHDAYEQKDFQKAVVLFEKLRFLSDDTTEVTNAILWKSYSFKAMQEYYQAEQTIRQIDPGKLDDSLVTLIFHERILLDYMQADFSGAVQNAESEKYFLDDTSKVDQNLYLKVLVYHEAKEWDTAKDLLTRYLQLNDLDTSGVDTLYFADEYKSTDRAKKLSTFLPGVGQIYGGSTKNGVINVMIQSGLVWLTVYTIGQGYIAVPLLSGIQNMYRYWSGGRRNAIFLADKHNKDLDRKTNEAIKAIVLRVESGNILSDK